MKKYQKPQPLNIDYDLANKNMKILIEAVQKGVSREEFKKLYESLPKSSNPEKE